MGRLQMMSKSMKTVWTLIAQQLAVVMIVKVEGTIILQARVQIKLKILHLKLDTI